MSLVKVKFDGRFDLVAINVNQIVICTEEYKIDDETGEKVAGTIIEMASGAEYVSEEPLVDFLTRVYNLEKGID